MASFGNGQIDPSRYDNRRDYLYAARDAEVAAGKDRKKAEFDRQMYEANGEEWEGQYGGSYGY